MKIIDCFIFYNELDMLELRLNELYDVVDHFVLVESTKTFVRNDKELYFENNKKRFSKFLDKIIHIIVEDKYIPDTSDPWFVEHNQRRCIDKGIRQLNLKNDDIIIISDVDEIPDSKTLLHVKNNNLINGAYVLEYDLYYYNLYCKMREKWKHPKIINYGCYYNDYYCDPEAVRSTGTLTLPVIKNGGWHLSFFGDIEFIKNKVKNFSHQEYNNEYILDDKRIFKRIQECEELLDNGWEFDYIDTEDNTYLPYKYRDFKEFLCKKL
jgi:beta-1,4-mannosyl-glycoprotein beta-1,4-N-acetylglucosaminyltransferase